MVLVGANYWCVILMAVPHVKLMPLIFSRKYLKCSTNFSAPLITPCVRLFIVNEAMFHHPASAVITSLCVVYHVAVHIMSAYITVTPHTQTSKYDELKFAAAKFAELFVPFISPDNPLLLLFIDPPTFAH